MMLMIDKIIAPRDAFSALTIVLESSSGIGASTMKTIPCITRCAYSSFSLLVRGFFH